MTDQKIIFITGKGGVGKSTVALAIAQKEAKTKKVLLVELGFRSFFGDLLHVPVSYQPIHYAPNLDLALWSGHECLSEYARYLLRLESLYKLFFENRIVRSLIDVAPALPELSILGKITSGIRKIGPPLEYDLIVVDGYATGHMLALLRAPRGMADTIQFGPMSEQSKSMIKTIRDPALCRYVIVSLPEELPAVEADELFHQLVDETGVTPTIYCNKVWPAERIHSLKKETPPPLQEEESKFLNELENIINQQEAWVHFLQHRHPKTALLPMVFSSDYQNVLNQMREKLP